nr:uncharacterized protein LOC110375503 isoform X3 [Helicoverpa armigera]
MVRSRARGVGGGGGALGGRGVRGRGRRGAALFSARRPPRREERPDREMAQEQPGARRFVRFVVGIRRRSGRSGRRHVGCRASVIRGARHSRAWPGRVLRRHRRQGTRFQNTCPASGGSVAHRRRARLLSAAYSLLHICEALLSTANHLQGEQKTVWMRGGRGDASGGERGGRRGRERRRARRAGAVLARAPPRRLLLRRVLAVQRRGGRAPAPVPHRLAAPAASTSGHGAPRHKLAKWVASERLQPECVAAERLAAQPGGGAGRGGAERADVAGAQYAGPRGRRQPEPRGSGCVAAAERDGECPGPQAAPAQRVLRRRTRRRTCA